MRSGKGHGSSVEDGSETAPWTLKGSCLRAFTGTTETRVSFPVSGVRGAVGEGRDETGREVNNVGEGRKDLISHRSDDSTIQLAQATLEGCDWAGEEVESRAFSLSAGEQLQKCGRRGIKLLSHGTWRSEVVLLVGCGCCRHVFAAVGGSVRGYIIARTRRDSCGVEGPLPLDDGGCWRFAFPNDVLQREILATAVTVHLCLYCTPWLYCREAAVICAVFSTVLQ